MRNIGTQEIETDRLLLRRFTLNDTYAMYHNWAVDEEVTSHLPWNSHKSMEETGRYILQVCQTYQNPDFYHWAIALKEKEQAIGFLQAEIEKNTDCARLSFCMGRQWWNKGYMKEAAGAVVPYLFEQVQAERISACCEGNNPTAGKVLLRCGLQGEGRLRRAWCGKKGITDLLCYGLLRSDYLRLKRLQKITVTVIILRAITRKGRRQKSGCMKNFVRAAGSRKTGTPYILYWERIQAFRPFTERRTVYAFR